MHRIIEQTAISSCGMVKTPKIYPATKETAAYGNYLPHTSAAQGPHPKDEARDQTFKKVADAHSPARLRDGFSPTQISRVLYCSTTTVYALVKRLVAWERATTGVFEDRARRGPKPLLDGPAEERMECLVEEESPTSHGWLCSRWSCKLLAVELFKERGPSW